MNNYNKVTVQWLKDNQVNQEIKTDKWTIEKT